MGSNRFDVIIIGGSYAGLSAAMSLGRSRRKVLVIDSGKLCNRQTPHSHNLITHDGETPAQIRQSALEQVSAYPTVQLLEGFTESVTGTAGEFVVKTAAGGKAFEAKRILLATGVRDVPLLIDGFAECWGISVLHCPYCHGYEVRDETLGVIGNGDIGFDYARLIRHWTPTLHLLTNGLSTLTGEQREKLVSHGVRIEERSIQAIRHQAGRMEAVVFGDGDELRLTAMFARGGIEQHSDIPTRLELELQTDGMVPALIKVDAFGRTSMGGVMAAGDNCIPFRSLANAIGAGTTAGAFMNNELIVAEF